MANVRFQYRSKKDRANIEVRFSYKDNDKWISKGTRTNMEVSKTFWKEYKSLKRDFKDVDKFNTQKNLEAEFKNITAFLLKRFENTTDAKKDFLKKAVKEYYNPKTEDAIPNELISYFDYYLNIKGNEIPPKSVHWQKWQQIRFKVELLEGYTEKSYLIKDVNEYFKKDFEDYL